MAEMYPDFTTASRRARRIARETSNWTCVIRHSIGWGIFVSRETLIQLRELMPPYKPPRNRREIYDDDATDAMYAIDTIPESDELKKEIAEELTDYADSWERSDEDGWYYADEM